MNSPFRRRRGECKPATYVRVAQQLLRTRSEISAGQVAFHAHKRSHRASEYYLPADRALADSGLFRRASFIGSNRFGITLWSAK